MLLLSTHFHIYILFGILMVVSNSLVVFGCFSKCCHDLIREVPGFRPAPANALSLGVVDISKIIKCSSLPHLRKKKINQLTNITELLPSTPGSFFIESMFFILWSKKFLMTVLSAVFFKTYYS